MDRLKHASSAAEQGPFHTNPSPPTLPPPAAVATATQSDLRSCTQRRLPALLLADLPCHPSCCGCRDAVAATVTHLHAPACSHTTYHVTPAAEATAKQPQLWSHAQTLLPAPTPAHLPCRWVSAAPCPQAPVLPAAAAHPTPDRPLRHPSCQAARMQSNLLFLSPCRHSPQPTCPVNPATCIGHMRPLPAPTPATYPFNPAAAATRQIPLTAPFTAHLPSS